MNDSGCNLFARSGGRFSSALARVCLAVAAILCSPGFLSAQIYTTVGNFQIAEYNDRISILRVDNYSLLPANLEIPAKLNGKPVTEIVAYAFEQAGQLISVKFPASVTKIGNYAFKDCAKLASAALPRNLQGIGSFAFLNCANLTSVSIPEGVIALGEGAFKECRKLASVSLPSTLADIGKDAFRECDLLTEVRIPAASNIGESAFAYCRMLEKVFFDEGVASIGLRAFDGCKNLKYISFPASLNRIGAYAFDSCILLEEAHFAGNAPQLGSAVFDGAAEGFTAFHQPGASGFSSPVWIAYGARTPSASLSVNAALTKFLATIGRPSSAQTVIVSGSNLTGQVSLEAPEGFEISTDGNFYSDFAALAATAGALLPTPVFIRLSASTVVRASFERELFVWSPGVSAQRLPVEGEIPVLIPPRGSYVGNFNTSPDLPAVPVEGVNQLGQLQINASGAGFSSVVIVEGKLLRLKGAFDPNKPTRISFTTPRSRTLRTFTLTYEAESRCISANMADAQGGALATFVCYRSKYGLSSPFPQGGRRFNSIMIAREVVGAPSLGHGFAAITAKSNGNLLFVGSLPDNTPISGTARLLDDPQGGVKALFCFPLPKTRSLLWGGASLESSSAPVDALLLSDPDDPLVWARALTDQSYPQGLLTLADFYGRAWNAAAAKSALADNPSFGITIGGVGGPEFACSWITTTKTAWTASGLPSESALKLHLATGALSGRLPQSQGGSPAPFRGLLLFPGFIEGASTLLGGGFSLLPASSISVEVSSN